MTLRSKVPFLITTALVLAALLAGHGSSYAASPLGIGTPDSPGLSNYGPFTGFFYWAAKQQMAFYKLLTGALKEMHTNGNAFWLLGGVSFLYGIFHAAGPGHGKAVITSYLFASRQTVRRGILIAFAAALTQGAVAIAFVLAATLILRATAIGMTKATDWITIMSYGMVAAMGAWLVWTKATGGSHSHSHAHAPASGDVHGHHGDHAHDDGHHHECTAGHDCSHAPDPQLLGSSRPLTVSRAWSAILAVGIRPCSGAIIILVFALSQHLLFAGLASVLVMSLGTAITVSTLVVLAVSAKDYALHLAGADSPAAERAVRAFEIAAALFVMLFGLTLFGGALAAGLP
jgi:nickel/cobalt transporter (NicO) family protein